VGTTNWHHQRVSEEEKQKEKEKAYVCVHRNCNYVFILGRSHLQKSRSEAQENMRQTSDGIKQK
jgi:hypothetical protein